ncbi:hypothetical protein KU6B_01310 [Mameliella alba]|nr:hypothetical protein KU6B_01310 [Mameliella alba]
MKTALASGRLTSFLPALAILLLFASQAAAHNVTEGDAGYIQEIWG